MTQASAGTPWVMDIEDTTCREVEHKRDWRWVIGDWVLAIGYGLLAIGDGLFQVFVYGIDANACREETECSYVDMVGIG